MTDGDAKVVALMAAVLLLHPSYQKRIDRVATDKAIADAKELLEEARKC